MTVTFQKFHKLFLYLQDTILVNIPEIHSGNNVQKDIWETLELQNPDLVHSANFSQHRTVLKSHCRTCFRSPSLLTQPFNGLPHNKP